MCVCWGRRGLMSFLEASPFLSTDPAGREALRPGLGLQDPRMSSLAGGFEAGITVTDKDAEVQRGPGSCPRPPSSEARGLATVPRACTLCSPSRARGEGQEDLLWE